MATYLKLLNRSNFSFSEPILSLEVSGVNLQISVGKYGGKPDIQGHIQTKWENRPIVYRFELNYRGALPKTETHEALAGKLKLSDENIAILKGIARLPVWRVASVPQPIQVETRDLELQTGQTLRLWPFESTPLQHLNLEFVLLNE
ncbi:hypothetical protein GT347_13190 [Xylophilus rhododendri]|uniref:Uncharacterized protein n=1 Tax=Xylophilus rhododendri TaxID=2697032 RepID=A0A857J742_9BURK|nr:hypothetical protein [Xylophilus rhododendri]QHI98861.1 hypothetical protein GT347_13190 [Xylophilus rhododendri]